MIIYRNVILRKAISSFVRMLAALVFVTIFSTGNLLAAGNNQANFTVSSQGSRQYVGMFGSAGTDNGEFNVPGYIAINSLQQIYVADHDNNRIQKFDSND